MKKIVMLLCVVGMFGFSLVGCRAEAEIDTRSNLVMPR